MSMMNTGSATWEGDLKGGKGTVSTKSGALSSQPYGFNTRFEGKPGTNPEELVGAAHAACFAMAMSLFLGNEGFTAEHMDAKSDVALEQEGGGFAIKKVHLTLKAKIPGIDDAAFQKIAKATKEGCPISALQRHDHDGRRAGVTGARRGGEVFVPAARRGTFGLPIASY